MALTKQWTNRGHSSPGEPRMTNGLVKLTVLDMYRVSQLNWNCVSQTSLSCVVPGWHGLQGTSFLWELKEGRGTAAMAPLHLRSQCRWPEATAGLMVIICLHTIQLLRANGSVQPFRNLPFAFCQGHDEWYWWKNGKKAQIVRASMVKGI